MTTLSDRYELIVKDYDLRRFTSQMTASNQNLVMRVNCYIIDHPEDSISRIVDMLGKENINIARVLKWMERKYIVKNENAVKHSTTRIKNGYSKQTDIKSPVLKVMRDEKAKAEATRQQQYDLGISQLPVDPDGEKEPTVQEIRKKIKNAIMLKINDAEVVSKYSSALKALSGVQDDEFDAELAEKDQMIVYCPQEEKQPVSLEVDPIDHEF